MVYICPIGSRGGMDYFFFWKSVFVKHPNHHNHAHVFTPLWSLSHRSRHVSVESHRLPPRSITCTCSSSSRLWDGTFANLYCFEFDLSCPKCPTPRIWRFESPPSSLAWSHWCRGSIPPVCHRCKDLLLYMSRQHNEDGESLFTNEKFLDIPTLASRFSQNERRGRVGQTRSRETSGDWEYF